MSIPRTMQCTESEVTSMRIAVKRRMLGRSSCLPGFRVVSNLKASTSQTQLKPSDMSGIEEDPSVQQEMPRYSPTVHCSEIAVRQE